MLLDLDTELAARGIQLAFAELKDPVTVRLRHYGLGQAITEDHFYRTLCDAVAAYRAAYPDATWRETAPDDGDPPEPREVSR